MPGASFESVEGDAFTGNVKIKLGLINLSYRGQAREEVTGSEAMRARNWTFTPRLGNVMTGCVAG
jgi:carbon monoxide dehydrogenase subunit G